MFAWISANFATIVVCIVLLVITGFVIRTIISDRKKGIHSCGYNCPGCSGSCGASRHPKK